MLTRLKVKGFKNLVDVDVWFGPFTCVAGANGVGKSNLLDAISLLSALADRPLIEAALSIRDEGGRTGDVRSLFHRVGNRYDDEMSFEAEMIVPDTGLDDLGQEARASSTFLRYSLSLRYRADETARSLGALELTHEELAYIKRGEARAHLPFRTNKEWRESAVKGRRWTPYYISTDSNGVIKVHQDGGSSGKARSLLAASLPRTALSAANAAESPTATLARREMQSWRLLQLEPSALREPDAFTAPVQLSPDGSHLPATLYHLAKSASNGAADAAGEAGVYAEVANVLAQLIDDVRAVNVDRDDRRELLTLYVTNRDATPYAARALSDGTLRFLALAVLALDPASEGLICLEEPENGIHPARIPAMIRLLQGLTANPELPRSPENPLRQVIVNTHSPAVVMQIPQASLLMAETREIELANGVLQSLVLRGLKGTWRERLPNSETVSLGNLLAYLNPVEFEGDESGRVVDMPDVGQFSLFGDAASCATRS